MIVIGYICHHDTSGNVKFCVPLYAINKVPNDPTPDPEPWHDWRFNDRSIPAIRDLAMLGTMEILARDLSDEIRSRLREAINRSQRHALGQLPSGVTFTEERATITRG